MHDQEIIIDQLPELKDPLLMAGFEGWGNALNVSDGTISFLIRKLGAEPFARINPDLFYRCDKSRPYVVIQDGILREFSPSGGAFYAADTLSCGRDIVILKSDEPHLRWNHFVKALFSLCHELGVHTLVTIGSMYDNVLHSDRIISGIASDETLLDELKQKHVIPINYQGPSAIHSTLHMEAIKRGIQSLSLWCHCPYYLEGAVHFGLVAHMGKLLSALGQFELDTEEMEIEWKKLNQQIQDLIEENPDLQSMVGEIRKAKVRTSWGGLKGAADKGKKVINLNEYINSK